MSEPFFQKQKEMIENNLKILRDEERCLETSLQKVHDLIELDEQKLQILQVSGSVSLRDLNPAEIWPKDKSKYTGGLVLLDNQLLVLRAVFGLDEREFDTLAELVNFLNPGRRINNSQMSRLGWGVKQKIIRGFSRVSSVLELGEDTLSLPDADKNFYVDLGKKYPGKTCDELSAIALRFSTSSRKEKGIEQVKAKSETSELIIPPNTGWLHFRGWQCKVMRAVFGLDGKEYVDVGEMISDIAYPGTSIRDQKRGGLLKMRKVLVGKIDTKILPEEDQLFYQDLATAYPEKTYEDLEKIVNDFLARKRTRESELTQKADSNLVVEDADLVLKPKTEALKPIYAALLYPDGPSLNKDVLIKRTRLTEVAVGPFLDGGLNILQKAWDTNGDSASELSLSEEESEEDLEVIKLCSAIKVKYPNQNLLEIVQSLSDGSLTLKFVSVGE